jgi:TPR repeat protein
MRSEAGDREEAERLARAAADSGNAAALVYLARRREEAGDREEAERLARAAADSADPFAQVYAQAYLAWMREEAGDREAAERLARAAADSGNAAALVSLAELRQGVAEEYQRYGLAADGTLAEPWAWPEPRTPLPVPHRRGDPKPPPPNCQAESSARTLYRNEARPQVEPPHCR